MKDFKPNAWMLPQPVMIIGTYDADGTPNAMNAAWGGQWENNEIVIYMGNYHKTTVNLERCPDFTLTFSTVENTSAADYVGIVSGKKQPDKISHTGWIVEHSKNVNAPIFTNFPLTMECRVKEITHETKVGYHIIAQIVNILCDEKYLGENGNPDIEKMNLIVFDPIIPKRYIALGAPVGEAFHDGKKLE